MKGVVAVRKVNGGGKLDSAIVNIANAYITVAVLTQACSAIIVGNSGANALTLAVGTAGNEVDTIIVIPPGVSSLMPMEFAKGSTLRVKNASALAANQTTGVVYVTCFA